MTDEIVIAEDEFANRDHGEFIEIVATPKGVRAWAEGEGGSVQKKCFVLWGDVLKYAPADLTTNALIWELAHRPEIQDIGIKEGVVEIRLHDLKRISSAVLLAELKRRETDP